MHALIYTLTGLSAVFFFISYLMNPGYLIPEIDFIKLLESFETFDDLCPDCLVIRTPESRHCSVCNKCVDRFDHHCPWINNCVGVRNHNFFLVYIYSQFTLLIVVLFTTLWCSGE